MKKAGIIFITLLFLVGCKAPSNVAQHTESAMPSSGLIHTVYFWLVEDITDEKKKDFEVALEELSKVPSISKYYWGPPAETIKREVVDNSYDYAINVFFETVEAQENYQVDPLHLKFVEECSPIFAKVIVYDNSY